MAVKVLSVGGSIIAPDKPNCDFLLNFTNMICSYLSQNPESRLILVAGGGGVAREYQGAYNRVTGALDGETRRFVALGSTSDEDAARDMIGITATRLNAQLLKALFGSLCKEEVVTNPTAQNGVSPSFTGRILVAAGWKPGFSTDNDAVLLAEIFGADTVINLSNIQKVYTDDPRKNPDARPIDYITWKDFRSIVGDEWDPGKNCPFDPVASKKAEELRLKVICAAGRNIENTKAILEGRPYEGTTIS